MAEEINLTTQTTDEGSATETDWQAKYEEMRGHMRDWEKKARANQSAADELEKLKAAQMTEQEKANARAEAAESELAQLKAEKAKRDAADELSSKTGIPVEMLMFCADEEAMNEFAKTYAEKTHTPSAPNAPSASRINRGNEKKPTNGEIFADFASQFFQ